MHEVGLDLGLLALRAICPQTVTQIVITSVGLLPEIVHLALERGPDPAVYSGQGQPSYMRQFTGSGLHLEFNFKHTPTFMTYIYMCLSRGHSGGLAREKVTLRFSCNDTELLPWCLGLF